MRTPRRIHRTAFLLLLLLPVVGDPGGDLGAQEREIEEAGLPRSTVDHLLGIVHDPSTHHLSGGPEVRVDSVLAGDVVVMGDFRLEGRIEGELVVVHGDLDLAPGSVVSGDLTVVDGEVRGAEEARVAGTLVAYRRGSRYVRRGDREREVVAGWRGPSHDFTPGSRVRFSVRGRDYNRVEGLPVHFGPTLDTGGANPFRVESGLIWRSQGRATFGRDRLGYEATARQYLGGRRGLHVGAGVHSTVAPVERAGMSDRENFLGALLFTTDARDYFERNGWRAFVGGTPRDLPIDWTVEYRSEEHGSLAVSDPWSLFGDRAWRFQPLVAEGRRESVSARVRLDTRDDEDEPLDGWLVRAEWDQGVGGDLRLPAVTLPEGPGGSATITLPALGDRYAAATLDVRRYQPLGDGGGVALRGVLSGAPGDDLLPPQHQHALGGSGSLPGHARFAADCGARTRPVELEREGVARAMYPYYGCDRIALAQVEYRGPLHLDFGFGRSHDDDDRRWRKGGASWAVFFDAARGWSNADWGELPRADSGGIYDAGLGLLLGRSGIYWAVPLGDGVRGSTFTVRLDRRF